MEDKRCGTCYYYVPQTPKGRDGVCECPVPCWVYIRTDPNCRVSVATYSNCPAWQAKNKDAPV